MDLTLNINQSTLRAIPSVHYRAVFAREINTLCSNPGTKPDAIAVELGPHVVREIAVWMKELGFGTDRKVVLPCMLGILVQNRLIHPDYRESALFLQEHFRKPLCEISPVLQKHLLHFSDQYLISLSSTDSIIEAIRCAVELDIPVYGIDLDEFSARTDCQMLIEDPSGPKFELHQYVSQNEKAAENMRDSYVDSRRELVMASRLKAILNNHVQVIYTGGMAHWTMLKDLLTNPSVRPAEIMTPQRKPEFARVIVHPRMAVRFMDAFPILTTRYEESRSHPKIDKGHLFLMTETEYVFREILQQTYTTWYANCESGSSGEPGIREGQRIPDFERLLASIRLVHQQNVSSISDLLEIARSMMPTPFIQILTSCLMEIGRPWTSPAEFPDLPIISDIPEEVGNTNSISEELYQLIESKLNNSDEGPQFKKRSAPFSVIYKPGINRKKQLLRHWQWAQEPKASHESKWLSAWIWPPCEALLFGSAYEAAKIAISESNEPDAAVFEGSIYNGLDVKASVRSIICGERKIYIKKPSASKKTFSPDGKKPEPTVFIFEDNMDNSSDWSLLIGGTSLGDHVKNKARYSEIVKKLGSNFISSISKIYPVEIPEHLQHHIDSISMLKGITAFGSPCINAYQGAQWVEDNDYQCCPVLPYNNYNLLIENYKELHQMDIAADNWQTALIRFAIPYAKERVVVIAPERFRISAGLYAEAKRRQISLVTLPLSYFPAAKIAEMRQRVTVYALDSDGCTFSSEVEAAIGQRADQYRELLPLYMQQQLNKTNI